MGNCRQERQLKVALVQQEAGPDRAQNRERGLAAVRSAVADGAELVCFAELAFDPFFPQVPAGPDVLSLAEPIPGKTTEAFAALAREHSIVIVLNLFECDQGICYDSSPVIDADGRILGSTRMVHITDYPCFHERGYYAPGNHGAPVYETALGRLGVAICYDRHFPEYMRALALAGAEFVVVPQAGAVAEWPDGLYEAEMQVAAFQNGYFTLLCNRVGKEEKLDFAGESFVCDPTGRVIAQAAPRKDEILLVELDLDMVAASHAKKLFLKDRRKELYESWLC